MLSALRSAVPPEALKVALVLALAFFVGLEREERKQHEPGYAFGGVRTFPLVALVSYALALISEPRLVPWGIGLAVVGALMLLSYYHRLSVEPAAGLTTELTALATYVVGGLVQREQYWIGTTIGVLSVLLLELKKALEGLARHVASSEIVTVAKFLLLAVVILPVVPERDLTSFHINPFKTWLVVVAVSGVSFASYVAERLLKERGGVLLSAILGGAYSSTVTTVVLSRQARDARRPGLFAGSILTASGMMYARLLVLIAFFDIELAAILAPAFVALGLVGGLGGWFVARRNEKTEPAPRRRQSERNPLELGSAFLFALVFVLVLVLTEVVRRHLGRAGLYALAAIIGISDVDPFILGIAQGGQAATPASLAAGAIVIAAASNNFIKAIYAYAFADRRTGGRALLLLVALGLLGLVPLLWT